MRQTYNLYDVATQAISNCFKKADPKRIKDALLTLDPLSPKRAYRKLSNILAVCDSKRATAVLN